MISVIVATYNGERYIIEQLESIRVQTLKPDEVIINDDRSNDNTANIVQNYIEKNNLINWKLKVNAINKGHRSNFLDGINDTQGEIVFFCDQDDVWKPNKVKKTIEVFEKHKGVSVVCCMTDSIDSEGVKIKNSLNQQRLNRTYNRIIPFQEQVRDNVSPGLALAVKRNVVENYIQIIKKHDLPHDLPVGLFASITNEYYIMDDILLYRRYHSNNVSTPKNSFKSRLVDVKFHIKGRKSRLLLHEVCFKEFSNLMNQKDKNNLSKLINYEKKTIIYLEKRNVFSLILNLLIFNPMINRTISVLNIACAMFGKY